MSERKDHAFNPATGSYRQSMWTEDEERERVASEDALREQILEQAGRTHLCVAGEAHPADQSALEQAEDDPDVLPTCNRPGIPESSPLSPGSTWRGPDGTVYDVVRLRALRNQVMLNTGERQFVDGDREEWCAACGKHIMRHYGGTEYHCDPRDDAASSAPPPTQGATDEPRPRWTAFQTISAVAGALGVPATAGAMLDEVSRLAGKIRASSDLRTSLRSLLGLPAGADDEAVRAAVEAVILAHDQTAGQCARSNRDLAAASNAIRDLARRAFEYTCETAADATAMLDHGIKRLRAEVTPIRELQAKHAAAMADVLRQRDEVQAKFEAEESAHLETLATLAETRSKLAAADRACEAARKRAEEAERALQISEYRREQVTKDRNSKRAELRALRAEVKQSHARPKARKPAKRKPRAKRGR